MHGFTSFPRNIPCCRRSFEKHEFVSCSFHDRHLVSIRESRSGHYMIWGGSGGSSSKQELETRNQEDVNDSFNGNSFAQMVSSVFDNENMPDNTRLIDEAKDEFLDEVKASEQGQSGGVKALFLLASVGAVTYFLSGQHDSFPMNIVFAAQNFLSDPTATLENIVEQVGTMGNLGIFYFFLFYTLAEVLAIPAIPLTASAGYLFGLKVGTATVLLSASVAASISFLIGRTALRPYVEGLLEKYPKFKALDKIIGKDGFRLILLLRLSPLFPFALSNYLYGVTSVDFLSYFWGTLLGFAPGTIAYVYTGEIGKALTLGGGESQPWYIYAAGLSLLVGFISIISDVATNIIEELEEIEDN